MHICRFGHRGPTDQDILARLIIDLKSKCALTGERRNAKLVYLALQSRRRRKPVSMVVKGQSASGKSYTVQCVLRPCCRVA